MSKKILSAVLASATILSTLSVSAFAADPTQVPGAAVSTAGATTYKVEAGFQAPSINVLVPSTYNAVINPYGVPVEIDTTVYGAGGIASPSYEFENKSSDVGIKVNVNASATTKTLTIVDSASAVKENADKFAYITLNADNADGQATGYTAVAAETAVIGEEEWAASKTMLKLSKAGDATPKGYLWFAGSVPEEPAEAWTTTDKVNINMVLDIKPFGVKPVTFEADDAGIFTAPVTSSEGTLVLTAVDKVASKYEYNLTLSVTSAVPAFTLNNASGTASYAMGNGITVFRLNNGNTAVQAITGSDGNTDDLTITVGTGKIIIHVTLTA